jgi:hypothetical protein
MMWANTTNHHRENKPCCHYNNMKLPPLSLPVNWHHYTKPEALKVLLANENRAAIKHMTEWNMYQSSNHPCIKFSNSITKVNPYWIQPDLAKVPGIYKQQNKTHTITDFYPSWHSMKMRVSNAFNSEALNKDIEP